MIKFQSVKMNHLLCLLASPILISKGTDKVVDIGDLSLNEIRTIPMI